MCRVRAGTINQDVRKDEDKVVDSVIVGTGGDVAKKVLFKTGRALLRWPVAARSSRSSCDPRNAKLCAWRVMWCISTCFARFAHAALARVAPLPGLTRSRPLATLLYPCKVI